MKIVIRPLSDITPYPGNPRKIDEVAVTKLQESISEYGFTNPILLDDDGVIVAGHTRFYAAEAAGLTQVPTITLHLTAEQARAYRLADNRTAQWTDWDYLALAEEVRALERIDDLDLSITSFPAQEIEQILASSRPYEPTLTERSVTVDGMQAAAEHLGEMTTDDQALVEVECPDCGHIFYIQGE